MSARGYVTEASRICRQASRRVAGAEHLARKAETMSGAAADLADLKPPESMARFDSVWVALVRQSATEFEAMVVSRRAGDDETAAHQRAALVTLTSRAAELAGNQGIEACPVPFRSGDAVQAGTVEHGT